MMKGEERYGTTKHRKDEAWEWFTRRNREHPKRVNGPASEQRRAVAGSGIGCGFWIGSLGISIPLIIMSLIIREGVAGQDMGSSAWLLFFLWTALIALWGVTTLFLVIRSVVRRSFAGNGGVWVGLGIGGLALASLLIET